MTDRPHRSVLLQDMGPLVRIRFGLSAVHGEHRRATGGSVPPALDLVALVDTGASGTFLLPGSFSRLGVQPTGCYGVHAAGGRKEDLPHYVGTLTLHGIGGDVDLVARATELDSLAGGVDAIIGRDTLGHGLLTYDGRAGSCALALKGVEIPLVDLEARSASR